MPDVCLINFTPEVVFFTLLNSKCRNLLLNSTCWNDIWKTVFCATLDRGSTKVGFCQQFYKFWVLFHFPWRILELSIISINLNHIIAYLWFHFIQLLLAIVILVFVVNEYIKDNRGYGKYVIILFYLIC